MLREDNIMIGIAIGVTVPVLGYLLVDGLLGLLETLGVRGMGQSIITFKERSMMLIALCANLIPFWFQGKLRNDNTMRGILIATAIYSIAWFIFYGTEILNVVD